MFSAFTRVKANTNDIGNIKYSNNATAQLVVPASNMVQYSLTIQPQQAVSGLHVDAYRTPPKYQTVSQISLQAIDPTNAYNIYNSEVLNRYQGGHTGSSPMFRMKEVLISLAIFGEGNLHIQTDESLTKHFKGFVDTLRTLLP